MKWTEADIIHASFLKPYEGADDFNDINPADNLLYRFLSDHAYIVEIKNS